MASSDWAQAAIGTFEDLLDQAGDPDRATKMATYMRDLFPFCGVQSKAMIEIQRETIARLGKPDRADVLAFARECWDMPEREYQYGATKLLRRYAKLLESDDLGQIRFFVVTKSWWDTVDELANHVVGTMVQADPALANSMDAWSTDPNMWVARTAILHQLRYKADTDTDRLFGYCRSQMGHNDFFIRKAIGWSLRQYARTDPDAVRAFVSEHEEELSGLSRREALKHL